MTFARLVPHVSNKNLLIGEARGKGLSRRDQSAAILTQVDDITRRTLCTQFG